MNSFYGIMTIKKGIKLYNINSERFDYIYGNYKPFIFCVFHPSEADIMNKYVHYIKLKKDINLLYLIEGFDKNRILSLINFETNEVNLDEFKKNKNKLNKYILKLKNLNLDGYITSIDNTGFIEIGLINEYEKYKKIKTVKLKKDWINSYEKNNIKVHKDWGEKYPINIKNNEIIIRINRNHKKKIEKYKKYEIKIGYKSEYIFQIILNIANIIYF